MVDREKKAKTIVEKLARDRFKDVEIVFVDVKEDFDFDGNEILWVKVVFSAENDRLDPRLTLGFVRQLRSKLWNSGIHQFPVTSYISKRDYESIPA